jgi:hypothetical protein
VTIDRSSIPERDLGWDGLCSGGCCCPCPCSLVQPVQVNDANKVAIAAGFRGETAHEVGQRRPGRHRHYTGDCCSLLLLFFYNRSHICWHSRRGGLLVVVPEQPRARLLSHPAHSGGGSCSGCSTGTACARLLSHPAHSGAGSCSACSTVFTCRCCCRCG